MKTKYFALIALSIFALALTACKDEPDNNTPPPKPIEVTFNVPAECANLNKTKPITIIFPATFTDTARQNTIKGKFVDAMPILNNKAGIDSGFQGKINAILVRGLKLTIVETSKVGDGMKVVDNQLVIESVWIEGVDSSNVGIAGAIIWFIDNNQLQ